MIMVWNWISLDRDSSWSWMMSNTPCYFNNKQILVTPGKQPDPEIDIYNGHTYVLKIGCIYGRGCVRFRWSME